MFTPRRFIMAVRLFFVFAAVGVGVLMLGPFQGLEKVFGLNDKAAHALAFYGLTVGLFLAAPIHRRDDLALFVVAAALGMELLQHFTGRSVSVTDFLAGLGGIAAAWLPGRIEQMRDVARRHPNLTPRQIAEVNRRRRNSDASPENGATAQGQRRV